MDGIAESVALAMGNDKTIVQMAKTYHFMQNGSKPDATALFETIELLQNSPAQLDKFLHEQAAAKNNSPQFEKLKDKAKKLAQENCWLRQRLICSQCKQVKLTDSGVTFLPCGHYITCEKCSEECKDCPFCDKTIYATVRTFMS